MTDIAVVGSINMDISIGVERIPKPGETVMGQDARWSGGGKGANQAVAAARLGRSVSMVGCVGDDAAGKDLVKRLAYDGVNTMYVSRVEGVATGLATIAVEADGGENCIVVSPGANAHLGPGHITKCPVLKSAAVVLAQLEVPVGAIAAAAVAAQGTVILNPAPARADVGQLLSGVDVLVPNQHELALLAGTPALTSVEAIVDAAYGLDGDADVIVTLGSKGALLIPRRKPGAEVWIEAEPVEAVDTTAAGDAFCGGLADAIAQGADLETAANWAVRVAAKAVQKEGAQDSLPYLADF